MEGATSREARAEQARARAALRRSQRASSDRVLVGGATQEPPDPAAAARSASRAQTIEKLKARTRSAPAADAEWDVVTSPRDGQPDGDGAAASPAGGAAAGPSPTFDGPLRPPTEQPSRPSALPFSSVSTSRLGGGGVTVGWTVQGTALGPPAQSCEWAWHIQYGKRVADTWHDAAGSDWAWQAAGGGWCGTVEGLKPGDKYVVRVRAHCAGSYGPWSKKSEAIVAAPLTSAAPAQPLSTTNTDDGSPLSAMVSDVRAGQWSAALAHLRQHTDPDNDGSWFQGAAPKRDLTPGEEQRIVEVLHVACAHGDVPPDLVKRLLVTYPRAAQEKRMLPAGATGVDQGGGEGMALLPLQRALFAGVAPAVVSVLLMPPGYSEAAARVMSRERCEGKLLPLHIAAGTPGTPDATVEALIAVHGKATGEREANGLLPLHIAIWNHMPLSIVQLLLAKTGGGARAQTGRDLDAMWPVHLAASVCVPRPLLEVLIAAEPRLLGSKTKSGRTALHCALAPRRPTPPELPPLDYWVPTVETLIASDPAALLATDNEGRTPLHLSLWTGAPLPMVEMLLAAAPEATLERSVRSVPRPFDPLFAHKCSAAQGRAWADAARHRCWTRLRSRRGGGAAARGAGGDAAAEQGVVAAAARGGLCRCARGGASRVARRRRQHGGQACGRRLCAASGAG